MAGVNPILPPVTADEIQYDPFVVNQKIDTVQAEVVAIQEGGTGGSELLEAAVTAYSPSLNTGVAGGLNFINASGQWINVGDTVVLAEIAGKAEYDCVGVIKTATISPGASLPAVVTSVNFPIRTDNLTNPMTLQYQKLGGTVHNADAISFDYNNVLGLPATSPTPDIIFGKNAITPGSINYLNRSNGAVGNLTGPVGTASVYDYLYFIINGSAVLAYNGRQSTLYKYNAGAWVLLRSSINILYDYTTQYVWAPGTTTSYVYYNGIETAVSTPVATWGTAFECNNGYLLYNRSTAPAGTYRKSSTDTAAPTLFNNRTTYASPTKNWFTDLASDGTYCVAAATNINLYSPGGVNTTISYPAGISSTTFLKTDVKFHSSGNILILGLMREDYASTLFTGGIPGADATKYIPILVSINPTTLAMTGNWYDNSHKVTTITEGANDTVLEPVTTSLKYVGGNLRFAIYLNSSTIGAISRVFDLTGL